MKSFFSNCNVAALRQLGGGRVLLDLCLTLPEFSKIITPQPASSSLLSLTSSRWALQLLFSSLFLLPFTSEPNPSLSFYSQINLYSHCHFEECFSLCIQLTCKFIRLFEHAFFLCPSFNFFSLSLKNN